MVKGYGWINDPKKATYNKIYNKTTFGLGSVFKTLGKGLDTLGAIFALIAGIIQMAFSLGVLYLIGYVIYNIFISF